MRKLIFILFTAMTAALSCKKDNTITSGNDPNSLIVTGIVSNINSYGATISGWANIPQEYLAICTFGIQCSTSSNFGTCTERSSTSIGSDNSFSVKVSSLDYSTKYYYRAYLKYLATGTYVYGKVKEFTTKGAAPEYGIQVGKTTNNSVQVKLNIYSTGGSPIKLCKIFYLKDFQFDSYNYSKHGVSTVELKSNFDDWVTVSGLDELSTYYFLGYVENQEGLSETRPTTGMKSVPAETTVTPPSNENPVDLGLSVKWASHELRSKETSSSYSVWYGEWAQTGKNHKYYISYQRYSKYNNTDKLTTMELSDDPARIILGGKWRTPTDTEVQELIDNCTIIHTTYQNESGTIIRSKVKGYEGKSIFIKASYGGYTLEKGTWSNSTNYMFWTSTLYTNSISPYSSANTFVCNMHNTGLYYIQREMEEALPIWPVCDK